METINIDYLEKHRKFRIDSRKLATVFFVSAFIVAIIVFWWLKLTGITMTGDALCETEEHLHSASCYEYTLICTDESEDHEHTSECTEKNLFCEISEHTHTSECYSTEEDITAGEEFMAMFGSTRATLEYTSHLEGEVVGAVITDKDGNVIGEDGVVYIGEHYTVALEFQEINKGDKWYQFKADENGYLTYHIPDNLQCTEFDSWHSITATGDDGTVANVGEYYVDANGLLKVKFYEDSDGVLFFDKYTNTDFSVEFDATVAGTSSGSSTEIDFGEEIKINVTVDGGADMTIEKTSGEYDPFNNEKEYTITVKATNGVVKDLVLYDDIWDSHYVSLSSVEVKDLDGNLIVPQPTISQNQDPLKHGANGFMIEDFPDLEAGKGYVITYKTKIVQDLLASDSVGMWNGLYVDGKDSNGSTIHKETSSWVSQKLKNFEKAGSQVTVETESGQKIDLIEWVVRIYKAGANLQGTMVIDTLGDGLAYYQGIPIKVRGVNDEGETKTYEIPWSEVTINGNTMEFELPIVNDGKITYYTSFDPLQAGETEKTFTNTVETIVDGEKFETNGTGQVVGFSPEVKKTSWGEDGEYVYFNIQTNVASMLKDRGYFFLTDHCAFWNYPVQNTHTYVDNKPEDIVITATLESGEVITFTPYVSGGETENTYILEAPSIANNGSEEYHTFKIYFNTRRAQYSASKWIHDENAVINISYKLPFDSKTGTNWTGVPNGTKTVGEILLEDEKISNEAYFNFMQDFSVTGTTAYEYSPPIIKKGIVNNDGTIDYTVMFHNTIPGSGGDGGYLTNAGIIRFLDTFDEKLEYVPGSLEVTCYDPWREGLWLCKYQFNGTAQGNILDANARDFIFKEYNYAGAQYDANGNELWGTWLAGTESYQAYCNAMRGGDHVFKYTLKVKDEYRYTTENSHFVFDNTAEVKWDTAGTSGPATEEVEFDTGLLNKTLEQQDDKLIFEVVVNEYGRDLLSGKDTLTVVDSMSENLSLYWDTIKLKYKNANGELVAFDSADSEYTYTVTYDATNNSLSFEIPDSLPVVIDYTCLVTESGTVSIRNAVKVDGKANVSDIIDAEFVVTNHTGGASGSLHSFTLIKQDGTTNARLPNAEFALYARVDPEITAPAGVDRTITLSSGRTMYYIASYTTGEDGTRKIENQYLTDGGPYALVELTAPEGYELLDKPVEFYFFEEDPDGVTQTVTTLLAVENFNVGYVLPETGGTGTLTFTIIGFALTAFPILYSTIRRKRERRFS